MLIFKYQFVNQRVLAPYQPKPQMTLEMFVDLKNSRIMYDSGWSGSYKAVVFLILDNNIFLDHSISEQSGEHKFKY